jgi:hypothetical protein
MLQIILALPSVVTFAKKINRVTVSKDHNGAL